MGIPDIRTFKAFGASSESLNGDLWLHQLGLSSSFLGDFSLHSIYGTILEYCRICNSEYKREQLSIDGMDFARIRNQMEALITEYGWPQCQPHPKLTERQKQELICLQNEIEADEVATVLLTPHQLIPTQETLTVKTVVDLIDVEFVPAILVLRVKGLLYIRDGHHRATRALLDGQLIRSVVFDLEVTNDCNQE